MNLPTELMFLSIDEGSGRISTNAAGHISYTLVAAFLMEIELQKRIDIQNRNVIILDPTPIEDFMIEDIFLELKEAKKPKKAYEWIYQGTVYYNRFRHTIFRYLMDQGIVGREESKVLTLFTMVRHPILRYDLQEQILARIQRVLLNEQAPDDRTIYLLALIKFGNLIKSLFGKEHRKEIEQKIDAFIRGHPFLEEIHQSITDAENLASSSAAMIFP